MGPAGNLVKILVPGVHMSRIIRSTGIVAASTLVSRILGFFRDVFMAHYFGAKRGVDIFYIAFMIPNLLRRLVAEGALTISFIPVYTEYLMKKGPDEARALAQKTLSVQTLIVTGIIVAGIVFTPQLMLIFYRDPSNHQLAVELTRIMFPYLFFAAFLAFAMGLLNSHGHFFSPAFSPVMLNIGMITGILFFRTLFAQPLYGVAAGVLLGGVLQLLIQLPDMARSGFRLKISVDFKHPGVRRIFALIAPSLFGTAVYLVNQMVSNMLATMLPAGSVTYIYYTTRLTELVMGIFIVSLASAILPEMSRMTAQDDHESLRKLYTTAVSGVLFLALPASVALMCVGLPVVSVFFMRGAFTPFNAAMTAQALFYSSIGMGSVAVLRITTPTFYSLKDTRTPVVTAFISFIVNFAFGYVLMHTPLLHSGLMLANSISATVQMLILFTVLQKRMGRLDLLPLGVSVVKICLASAAMGVAVWYAASFVDWVKVRFLYRIAFLAGIVFLGVGVYVAAAFALRVREIDYLYTRVVKRLLARLRKKS